MGKRIINGNQIEIGVRVKLTKNFASIPVESEAIIQDYELNEQFEIESIVLKWDNFGVYPYVTSDIDSDMNIINFIEIIN